jgi:hypothetical protein
MATATNFTWTGTGGFTANASIARTYTFGSTSGGTAANSPNLAITSGATSPTFTSTSWFNTLNFTGTTLAATGNVYVNTLTLAVNGDYSGFTPIFTRTQVWSAQYSKQLGGIGFNLVGGTLTLDGSQTYNTTSIFNLVAGTLNLGGSNLTIGTFSSSNTNVRSISFGANNIILATTTASANNINMATATNFTWTGIGGFVAAADIARTYLFGTTAGGTSSNAVNLAINSGSSTSQIFVDASNNNSWINKLDFTGNSSSFAVWTTVNVNTLLLSINGTYSNFSPIFTRTQTWSAQFSKQLGGFGVNIPNGTLTLDGTQSFTNLQYFYFTQGTLDLGNFNLTLSTIDGSNSNTRSIVFGSKNITVNSSISMANATNFSCTGTGGFIVSAITYNLGSTSGAPTSSPNVTVTGSSVPSITTGSWFRTLDFGSTSNDPGTTTVNVTGLTLSASGSYNSLSVNMTGTGNLIGNSRTLSGTLTYNTTGQVTLGSAITVQTTVFTEGTLNLNGFTYTSTSGGVNSTSSFSRRITGPGTMFSSSIPSTIWNITNGTGFTASGYNITLSATANVVTTFAGGGGSYGTINVISTVPATTTINITGSNTFENITATALPTIFNFTAGTTQTVRAFTASGRNNIATVTLKSSTPGTQASLSNPNEVISVNYLIISDSNATGGASWYANSTSVDGGNNTGWNFTGPPAPAAITGQAFVFF